MSDNQLSAEDWTTKFISNVLSIKDPSGLYINVIVHEVMMNGVSCLKKDDIFKRIEEQSDQSSNELSDEKKYFWRLKCHIKEKSGKTERCWLCALESARSLAKNRYQKCEQNDHDTVRELEASRVCALVCLDFVYSYENFTADSFSSRHLH